MNSKECPKCKWCNPDDAASCRECGYEWNARPNNPGDAQREPAKPCSRAASGCAALVEIIRELRIAIWEHHSHDCMKEEHIICPVCTRKEIDDLLNRAVKAEAQHNDALCRPAGDAGGAQKELSK